MSGHRLRPLLLTGGVLAALVVGPGAAAARHGPHHAARVAPGFFGVVYDPSLTTGPLPLSGQAGLMHRAGVQTVGLAFNWAVEQPYQSVGDVPPRQRRRFVRVGGVPTDWGPTDREVEATARAGLRVLPTVVLAPPWGAVNPDRPWSPPLAKPYAAYCRALAGRYGPHGSFWRHRPHLHREPIRTWQIWNEPTSGVGGIHSPFWNDAGSFAPRYVRILHRVHDAIRSRDPRARIIVAGLIGRSWKTMARLYKLGAGRWFDGVALHPYINHADDVVKVLRLVRSVMNRHGDRHKPLLITELGFPTSLPGSQRAARRFLRPATLYPLQASWLGSTFDRLYRLRHRLGIGTVLWFAWATSDHYRPGKDFNGGFSYMGLVHRTASGKVRRKPALSAYYYVAHHLPAKYRRRHRRHRRP